MVMKGLKGIARWKYIDPSIQKTWFSVMYELVEASPISELADSQGGSLPGRILSGCIAKYIMAGCNKKLAFSDFHFQCLLKYSKAVDQLFTSLIGSAPFLSVAVCRGLLPRLY